MGHRDPLHPPKSHPKSPESISGGPQIGGAPARVRLNFRLGRRNSGPCSENYPRCSSLWIVRAVTVALTGTLCYAMVLPGRKSAFRARLWPDCYREITEIGPPAGQKPISLLSGGSPAKIRPGRPIYGPEAVVRNIE